MAKIETTFIRPKELFTPETGETKVVYDGYQNNPHELVVQENLEGDVSEIVNDTFVPNDGGNVVFTDGSDVEHELITKSGLGKAQVIETTWQALKDLRDNSQLIAGSLYRITDYNCTTTQENTQSAGHQFDIVLLALSANKLAEEGWAMEHPTDVYDVTFSDGVTKKCYLYDEENSEQWNLVDVETLLGANFDLDGAVAFGLINIDRQNKTIVFSPEAEVTVDGIDEENLPYNYFQNSNLSAWKVWYCLDNDTDRFAWAMGMQPASAIFRIDGDESVTRYQEGDLEEGGENYFAWQTDSHSTYYTLSEEPSAGDDVYDTALDISGSVVSYSPPSEGRGVIYRLIDEFNNDIKYDFKNIQFKRTITDGQYDENGTDTWCYTLNVWYNDMCQDASIVGNTLLNDEGHISGVYDNIFGYATAYDLLIKGVDTFAYALGNNVVLSFDDYGYLGICSNTIGDTFHSNTIGNVLRFNTIGNYIVSNLIGNGFSSNIIGNTFVSNTIGNGCESNTIGNAFTNKTIGDNLNGKNYGNNGVELATKDDIGDIETALNNI